MSNLKSKSLLAILSLLLLLNTLFPLGIHADEGWEELERELAAKELCSPIAYVVYVGPDGAWQPLLEHQIDQWHRPASLTKLMTLYTASKIMAEQGISPEESYEIQEEDYAGLAEANIAVCGFEEGDTLTVYELLAGSLIASGADAVQALISALGLSRAEFVARMNADARALGADLSFCDAVGLDDPAQRVTARGIAILLNAVLEDPLLNEIMRQTEFTATLQDGKSHSWQHSFLNYAEILGLDARLIQGGKTGWIQASGYNLATFQELDAGRLLIVTMGATAPGTHVLDHVDILTSCGQYFKLPRADLVDFSQLAEQVSELRYGLPETSPAPTMTRELEHGAERGDLAGQTVTRPEPPETEEEARLPEKSELRTQPLEERSTLEAESSPVSSETEAKEPRTLSVSSEESWNWPASALLLLLMLLAIIYLSLNLTKRG